MYIILNFILNVKNAVMYAHDFLLFVFEKIFHINYTNAYKMHLKNSYIKIQGG